MSKLNYSHLLQYNNERYEDTLEPTTVSVDISELELVENENGPRENHSVLLDVSTKNLCILQVNTLQSQ